MDNRVNGWQLNAKNGDHLPKEKPYPVAAPLPWDSSLRKDFQNLPRRQLERVHTRKQKVTSQTVKTVGYVSNFFTIFPFSRFCTYGTDSPADRNKWRKDDNESRTSSQDHTFWLNKPSSLDNYVLPAAGYCM